MSRIELRGINKYYGRNHVLKDINLVIEDGEFMTLLGPSGCGKTTTLRVVAGLEKPQEGYMYMGDREIVNAPEKFYEEPGKRHLNLVFQSYALWPHMTVFDNVAFGLEVAKVPKEEIRRKVENALKRMRIEAFIDRYPSELSGGQQQRVAIARAIVSEPEVLLLDEPLSNLDAKLRIEMRSAIRDVQKQVGITTVYVTHDQEEALAISDRIAVMKLGIIQQIGSPQDIYARPYNAFVSTFIGHSNLFFGTIRKQGSVPSVVFEGGYHVEMANLVDTVTEGQKVVVSVRPEEFSLNPEGMECEIISRTFLGKYTNYFLRFGDGMVLEDQPSIEYSQDLGHVDRIFSVGEKIRLRPNPNKINVFTQDMEQSLIKDVKRYDE